MSRIRGTDKRSKTWSELLRENDPSRFSHLTNGVPSATVCIAARLHPRFKVPSLPPSTPTHTPTHSHIHIATILRIRTPAFPANNRCVRRREMRLARNEMSNDDLLRGDFG